MEGDSITEAQSWIGNVKLRFESGRYKTRKSSSRVSIYRVPESIKKTNPKAYDPLVISLGPFHHNKCQKLTVADDYKLQALECTLGRLHGMTINDLVANVIELDQEIRDRYEDSAIEWDRDTLAWIMTMDACFILEFLRMEMPDSSLVFRTLKQFNVKRREIISDIMKLENQIPLLVLKRILQLELKFENPRDVAGHLTQLLSCMSWYFESFPFSLERRYDTLVPKISNLMAGGVDHLLDLSRKMSADFLSNSEPEPERARGFCDLRVGFGNYICIANLNRVHFIRPEPGSHEPEAEESFIPSAVKLRTAGIKLKASKGKLDFKQKRFRRSILLVPEITVEDDTETLLRNLVAFEECHMNYGSQMERVISGNMWIMDQLINSKEDVQLLQDAGIIKNYLGTEDEVAKIFNDLCTGITSADHFKDVLDNVRKHFNGWKTLKGSMKEFQENTCPNAWYIVSFLLATVIFGSSLLQAIYTIMSYYHSK